MHVAQLIVELHLASITTRISACQSRIIQAKANDGKKMCNEHDNRST